MSDGGGGVQVISGGTVALGTAAVPSGGCASAVSSSASGVAANDTIIYNPNTDPTVVQGYRPSASGSLYIWAFPSANKVSFVVCNPSSATITPGTLSVNWKVLSIPSSGSSSPALTSITPDDGAQGATITGVTLSGSNLSGATINTPTGITVSNVTTSASSIMATFTISATAPTGPQSVTVTNGGVTSNAVTFTINAASFTPIRINSGGGAYTDIMGNVWSADSGYNSGNVLTTTSAIAGTPDQPLYQNWRAALDNSPLIYTFNSIPNGSYTVNLDFADPQDYAAGQRVFNVAINGVTVL
jgi:hypothetical protein